MLQSLGSNPSESSRESNKTAGSREGSPLEGEGGWVKNQALYHVSLADQEYLAFSLWSHKWIASVTAETKPAGPDCLTATMTKKEAVLLVEVDWTAL